LNLACPVLEIGATFWEEGSKWHRP